VKKRNKKEPIRFFHFLLILFLLCVAAGISHVWVNFKRTQTGYALSRLKEEIVNAEEYNRKLKLEIAFLKSPENLEKKAREHGLRYPSPEQIVILP
jgi:cell division protein FtsL